MIDIISIIKKFKKKTFSAINPLATQKINENIYSIKDMDSNFFIYKKGNTIISIDSGYQNSQDQISSFSNLPFSSSDIEAVFLTHIDSDHAGCLYEENPKLYKDSKIYLHEEEKTHLLRRKERVRLGPFKIKHKLSTTRDITYFNTNEPIYIGDIKIQPILTAGHTLGHTCFFIDDKYLFTGDSIILKNGIGYRFFDLLGYNNTQNSNSLLELRDFAFKNNCRGIFTSHTGYTSDLEKAFLNCDKKIT